MVKKYIIAVFVLFLCVEISAKENPFMQMAGKPYAEYSEDLYNEFLKMSLLDTIESRKIISQIGAVVKKTGSEEWKLIADFFEVELHWRKSMIYGDKQFPSEETVKMAWLLLEKIKAANIVYLELILRQKIIDYYWSHLNNYEMVFELYKAQEEQLDRVSSEEIPEKADYIVKIANMYYHFKDYQHAIIYFNKALAEGDNVRTLYVKQHARNGLGLSYLFLNEIDRSDAYFLAIKEVADKHPEDERFFYSWHGIADGNLGNNMLLRKEYNKAIPLLKSSFEKMLKVNDLEYAAGVAIDLAEIYLIQGNLPQAKYYIDLGVDFYTKMPRRRYLPHIHEIQSRYYAIAGNAKLSMEYMDSMLMEKRKLEEEFNSILLLRSEQKESAKQEQQLQQEIKVRTQTQRQLLIVSIAFIIIVCLSGYIYVLFRRNHNAYHELARKSQQWAAVPTEEDDILDEMDDVHEDKDDEEIHDAYSDEVDLLLMSSIERLMKEEKIYKDPTLTVDMIAEKLDTKRHAISVIINRCTKKNFNTFINEYRIKEAIQMLSKEDLKIFSIDHIASNSGFNDRINFYRIFKKITGLSPSEFKKNVG